MKTVSLTQPWATLVVIGAKKFETRSWSTKYRGPLLIHASKKFPKWARQFSTELVCYEARRLHYVSVPAGYPVGVVVGRVELTECIPTDRWMIDHCDVVKTEEQNAELHIKREWWTEFKLGDYSDGRFAWQLSNPECFCEPIPANGSLGIWEFPESVLGHLLENR